MILSVSRRTDIPAFYSDWFYNRLREGDVLVRNPMNFHQVSRINLSPNVIDCISFWTKNPAPMLARIDEMAAYPYYFQVTVNPYGNSIERSVPDVETVTDSMAQISRKTSSDRVIWRYDPVFYAEGFGMKEHLESFEKIARRLSGHVNRCIIGFLNWYAKTVRNTAGLKINSLLRNEIIELSLKFKYIASEYGIDLRGCSDNYGLAEQGIAHATCIDPELVSKLCGFSIVSKKDKNQRIICNCCESIDIGAYGTCSHKCLYCYANKTPGEADGNYLLHDPLSPFLLGGYREGDIIRDRKLISPRTNTLFDI